MTSEPDDTSRRRPPTIDLKATEVESEQPASTAEAGATGAADDRTEDESAAGRRARWDFAESAGSLKRGAAGGVRHRRSGGCADDARDRRGAVGVRRAAAARRDGAAARQRAITTCRHQGALGAARQDRGGAGVAAGRRSRRNGRTPGWRAGSPRQKRKRNRSAIRSPPSIAALTALPRPRATRWHAPMPPPRRSRRPRAPRSKQASSAPTSMRWRTALRRSKVQ